MKQKMRLFLGVVFVLVALAATGYSLHQASAQSGGGSSSGSRIDGFPYP